MAEAAQRIKELTGIERKPTQIRNFLRRLGLKPLRMGTIPAKADPKVQEQYLQEVLEPKLAEAQRGERVVFFMDASHFVLAPFIGILWCFKRLWLRAPTGRQRFNVLGALNALTKEVTMVTNDTYITATQVCQLLQKLATENPGKTISVVLDNARYQRCALAQECARTLNIELLFLPSYSPNLNLIERFWKYVKKDCLYNHYYSTFTEFKQAIIDSITQAPARNPNKLHSLLSLRFQLFKSENLAA